MFSVALLLLLAAGSCVKCEQLTQPASVTVQPGQRLTITCQVSYDLRNYATHWIRQPAGKGLEWIGFNCVGCTPNYKDSLKNKFSISVDSSSKTVTLNGQNLQPEDSAVYYCARDWVGFDYWGKGTKVTVSTETAERAHLFPLVQCNSGSADTVTVGCLARDFYPEGLTFQWTDASGGNLNSEQYPAAMKDNKYTEVSLVKVSKSDWESGKFLKCSVTPPGNPESVKLEKKTTLPPKITLLAAPVGDTQALVCTTENLPSKELSVKWKKSEDYITDFTSWDPKISGEVYTAVSVLKVKNTDWDSEAVYTCEMTHQGTTYIKKASKATITMTLSKSSPKEIFNNNQAKLQCVITGKEQDTVNDVQITWQINGKSVTDKVETTVSGSSKISTMTQNRSEWQKVKRVRCSAIKDDMTPVIQDLTVNTGDGSEPKVTVHILPKEDISEADSSAITLVCLVSSSVLQDYYITWSEDNGNTAGTYIDGVNFPPQKTQNGYSVTSIYTTTKEKWDGATMFSCNVWPAVGENPMKTHNVSKFQCGTKESKK